MGGGMVETGPNGVKHVVWALGIFFFQFIVYNIANHIYYCFNFTSTTTTTTHQVVASLTTNDNTMMKTIPNTTSIHRVIDSLAGYMTMSDGPY